MYKEVRGAHDSGGLRIQILQYWYGGDPPATAELYGRERKAGARSTHGGLIYTVLSPMVALIHS